MILDCSLPLAPRSRGAAERAQLHAVPARGSGGNLIARLDHRLGSDGWFWRYNRFRRRRGFARCHGDRGRSLAGGPLGRVDWSLRKIQVLDSNSRLVGARTIGVKSKKLLVASRCVSRKRRLPISLFLQILDPCLGLRREVAVRVAL